VGFIHKTSFKLFAIIIYMPIIQTEFEEQKNFCEWLTLKNIKHSSIPNSTYTKSWSQKMKNKQSGLNPGLPDLLICLPNILLFIEMKRTKGGVVSEVQKEWIDTLNEYPSVYAKVCKGYDEAVKFVEDCLKIDVNYQFFKKRG